MRWPPAPLPSSGPATAFSAECAYPHLQRIAGPQLTPIGRAGSDAIRDYVASNLSAAGFSVEIQAGVGSRMSGNTTVAGREENVVAVLSGYDSPGAAVRPAGALLARLARRYDCCRLPELGPAQRPLRHA
jgi:hypothetical protein